VVRLGGVDGFHEEEAESKGNHGAVILGRLLAAELYTLEPLQLANELLDAGASPVKRWWSAFSLGSAATGGSISSLIVNLTSLRRTLAYSSTRDNSRARVGRGPTAVI
jgi:hypothetical protein